MNVVDTSGWLEYFADTVNAKNFENAILDTENLLVPVVVIYEVFKKVLNEFNEDKALTVIGHMKMGKVINIDEDIAINAAKISAAKKMPMADSLIYSIALKHTAIIYTQDSHFENLEFVKYFNKE